MKNYGEKKKLDYAFSQMMQEASQVYQEQYLKDMDIDDAFIEERIKAKKKQKIKRYFTSAAAVMLILLTGLMINVWFQADGVYGGKRFVKKCVTLISPLNYDEEIGDDGSITTIVSIDDEKHLDAAAEYFDQLKTAKYIPAGYQFKQLTIREYSEPVAEYIYTNGENALAITFFYSNGNEHEDIMVVGDEYRSPASGKTFYVSENKSIHEYCVIEITANYECIVSGIGELKDGIKIMENIGDIEARQ